MSAFNCVNSSARRETSVATTLAEFLSARNAWMPHPVPTSSIRATGVVNCRPANVSDAPPTPST